jgi:hypothetical protein
LTEAQKGQVVKAKKATDAGFWGLVISMLPFIFSYMMDQIWEAIDIIQLVYYMLFVNVWKPLNVT